MAVYQRHQDEIHVKVPRSNALPSTSVFQSPHLDPQQERKSRSEEGFQQTTLKPQSLKHPTPSSESVKNPYSLITFTPTPYFPIPPKLPSLPTLLGQPHPIEVNSIPIPILPFSRNTLAYHQLETPCLHNNLIKIQSPPPRHGKSTTTPITTHHSEGKKYRILGKQ